MVKFRNLPAVSLVLIVCLIVSCTDGNLRSAHIEKKVETTDTITRVSITKKSNFLRFHVHLIPDTFHAFFLEGEKIHVESMEVQTDNNKLTLIDHNSWSISGGFHEMVHFNWHIPPDKSFTLHINGSPINISSADTLRNPSFVIASSKSFGTIDVLVANNRCAISQNSGSADFIVKGRTGRLSLTSNGSGPMRMNELIAEEVHVSTEGRNDVYIYCEKQLNATINNIGNVYYAGNPGDINVNGSGPGQLIAITSEQ